MKESSIEILERHKHHWFTLKNAGYINNLDYPVKLEIQSVIREELDPYYHENLWCAECLINMIRRIYTHYERYQESQQEVPGQVSSSEVAPVFEPLPEVTEENKAEVNTSKPSRKKSK